MMMITIPIHEEEGWVAKSPTDGLPVRQRLSSPASPKAPKDLRLAEERAALLRAAHLDAVQQRAQRDCLRVKEAKQRRLRAESAAREKVQARLDASERKRASKKEATNARTHEVSSLISERREAVLEAREEIARATTSRGLAALARVEDAKAKRDKYRQAIVDKSRLTVKHALAVAASVKEREREAAEKAGEALAMRLEAAESRRLGLDPPSGGGSAPASPASPVASTVAPWASARPVSAAAARAKQVARALNEQAISLEKKRATLDSAMSKAASAHEDIIDAKVARAKMSRLNRAEEVKEARAAKDAAKEAARANHFERLQDAEVRRQLAFIQKTSPAPCVIDATIPPKAAAVPPRALVARLSLRPRTLAATAVARQRAAAARRAAMRLKLMARTTERTVLAAKVASRRAVAIDVVRAKAEARADRATDAAKTFLCARRALDVDGRVRVAAKRRSLAQTKVRERVASRTKRTEKVQEANKAARTAEKEKAGAKHQAAADKRALALYELAERGVAAGARADGAAKRRAYFISARVAKAKLSGTHRGVAVKLTAAAADGVVGLEIRVDVKAVGEAKAEVSKAKATKAEAAPDNASEAALAPETKEPEKVPENVEGAKVSENDEEGEDFVVVSTPPAAEA